MLIDEICLKAKKAAEKLSVLDSNSEMQRKKEAGISAFFERSAKSPLKGKAN